jgi:hypothetical protein
MGTCHDLIGGGAVYIGNSFMLIVFASSISLVNDI